MTSAFEADRASLLETAAASRLGLLAVVQPLTPDDLALSRPGSWTVARVLDHVIHSERLYTQLVSALGGEPAAPAEPIPHANSANSAVVGLASTRKALLDAVGAVTEDDFYQLKTIGHEQYSVLSILENVAAHDNEHAEQIRKTIESR